MPTGYTADLTETTSFPDFVMRCSRAFGALVLMRDGPLDAPIKRFEPSDFNTKRLAEARAELAALQRLSDEEAAEISKREHAKRQKEFEDAAAKENATERSYRRMLSLVEEWKPPTPEHEGLKNFMREQLTESIRFDGDYSYFEDRATQPCKTGSQWRADRMHSIRRMLAQYENSNREEIERTASRNKWVDDLRRSLGIAG